MFMHMLVVLGGLVVRLDPLHGAHLHGNQGFFVLMLIICALGASTWTHAFRV